MIFQFKYATQINKKRHKVRKGSEALKGVTMDTKSGPPDVKNLAKLHI